MLHRDAIKAYQAAEQDLLVEGADPHSLVQILYSELLASLERAQASLAAADLAGKSNHLTKALTILHVLASSLDFEKGGDVAASLAHLYEWARRRVIEASRHNLESALEEVRKAIGEIAEAWTAIARTSTRAA